MQSIWRSWDNTSYCYRFIFQHDFPAPMIHCACVNDSEARKKLNILTHGTRKIRHFWYIEYSRSSGSSSFRPRLPFLSLPQALSHQFLMAQFAYPRASIGPRCPPRILILKNDLRIPTACRIWCGCSRGRLLRPRFTLCYSQPSQPLQCGPLLLALPSAHSWWEVISPS